MKNKLFKRVMALIAVVLMAFTLVPTSLYESANAYAAEVSAGSIAKNQGTRDQVATALSADAVNYYATNGVSYDVLKTKSGAEIKSAVTKLMSETVTSSVSYKSLTGYWKDTDSEAGNSSDATLFYSDVESSAYNREHVWPKSHGSFYESNGGSDLHHLRPTNERVNSTRGHYTMGNVDKSASKTVDYNGKTVGWYYTSSSSELADGMFMPLDNVKGDVARIFLYMYTRWDQPNLFENISNPKNDGTGSNYKNDGKKVIESLETLLEWCANDPVDTWEMQRNDLVEDVQGNRNVFIDYPELAWLMFNQEVPANLVTPTSGNTVVTPVTPVVTPSEAPTPVVTDTPVPTDTPVVLGNTYKKISSASEIGEGGNFVLYGVNGTYAKAMSNTLNSKKVNGVDVTINNDVIENPSEDIIWTLERLSDGSYSLYNKAVKKYLVLDTNKPAGFSLADTASLAYKASSYKADDCIFLQTTMSGNSRAISLYQTDFRAYTTADYKPLYLFKQEAAAVPTPTAAPTATPVPTEKPDDTVAIAAALAGAAGETFKVKGVVTFVEGKNVYLQDATGGICAYLTAADSSIKPGDTLIAQGSKKVFNGLPELDAAKAEKSEGLTLTAETKKIGELTAADICRYIKLEGVEITEIYDNNGTYANANITVKDETGSIQLYKAVADKASLAVGDKVDILAAVGYYNKFQLRNTYESEVTKAGTVPTPTATPVPTATPTPTAAPTPTVQPDDTVEISTALAGAANEVFKVKGVVTAIDGKNLYLQDATGAIDAYCSSQPAGIALGDTVVAQGKRTTFNGLPELGSATAEKVTEGTIALSAAFRTIDRITDADICTYVELEDLEITEVYDNNNTYSTPNITVTDGKNKIQIYKAVINKVDGTWEYKVGDHIDIKAAVGVYQKNNEGAKTYQLRNTLAAEITKTPEVRVPAGKTVVIYSESAKKVLASVNTSKKVNAVSASIENGKASCEDGAYVFTIEKNGEYYRFYNEQFGYLSANGTGSNLFYSKPGSADYVAEEGDWTVKRGTNNDGWYLISRVAKYSGKEQYVEFYTTFTTYSYKAANDEIYVFNFYETDDNVVDGVVARTVSEDMFKDGVEYVIYNIGAKGVVAGENDVLSAKNALATIKDGVAVEVANGGRVFKVTKNGEYYRFYNEADGFLCSNGTGSNCFYKKADAADYVAEEADWKISPAPVANAFHMVSRAAKYNGKYEQWLEYYADSYKTYSYYNVTDETIYAFQFYPTTEELTEGIVNKPGVVEELRANAYVGSDYDMAIKLVSEFGLEKVSVKVGSTVLTYTVDETGSYNVTVPAELIKAPVLTVTVSGNDTKNKTFTDDIVINVIDEPTFDELTPAQNANTMNDKRPVISAVIGNAGENAAVEMTVNQVKVDAVFANGVVSYQAAEDMPEGKTTVTVTVTRADGAKASKSWSFFVGEAKESLYFGQLHSHTAQYSDGAGTLAEGLTYIKNLPASANVDFVAFTDHSNYFDTTSAANPEAALFDTGLMTAASLEKWTNYTTDMRKFNDSQNSVVALPGFEMTWSGGPGHINTWNTAGVVSRNNATLNNKTNNAGIQAYYSLLSGEAGAESLSQLNHPGSTFGTFVDFSFWNAVIDSRVFLVEVGNGEGQIGAGGYYPSYEYYTMALDKGWHVAPTNNQDNHKGKWGNANDARDVILTDDFSEEGLYNAIRNLKVYATEDKNLEIGYTLNGKALGSTIAEVPEKLNIEVSVFDPDATDSISKVEVIVNSGKTAYVWDNAAELATGALSCELNPDYSYYYIRVTEGDGDIAVTAPVWVGETLKLGISSVVCGTSTPVTNEEVEITTTLFNSENSDAKITSIVYTVDGNVVVGTDTTEQAIPALATKDITFKYTPSKAKVTTLNVTVNVELDGKEYTFTMGVELDVLNADDLIYIGIDASHYNEYVAGNYKDSMGNFGLLAAGYSVRTNDLKTSEALIDACSNEKYKAIILTAPSRRLAAAQANPGVYSDAEIEALRAFAAKGGTIVLAGWSDYYENYDAVGNNMTHMSTEQNRILSALGSSLRINDDATRDDSYNGGQAQRLYFASFNMDSYLLEGVDVDLNHVHDYSGNDKLYTEFYSQYGGCSIYAVDENGNATNKVPSNVTPVVFGHETTYTEDSDNDGLATVNGTTPKYAYGDEERILVLATEELDFNGTKATVIVAGAAFMSNFEVQATISDNGAEKNYCNYKLCENLVKSINPVKVTPIAEVQAQTEAGIKYTIEGIVTSNASGYDKETAFFDCIYVQDATAGICCFPVAGEYKIGDKVRITGTTDWYQGEAELQVTKIEVIGSGEVKPVAATAADLNALKLLGSLVTVSGEVTDIVYANGIVESIYVKDATGVTRIFIDGYITSTKEIENLEIGGKVTATGLSSYDNTYAGTAPRIRVRDRADVVCEKAAPVFYTVRFFNFENRVISTQKVAAGGDAEAPIVSYPNYIFTGWDKPFTNVQADTDVRPTFEVENRYKLTVIWGLEGVANTETYYNAVTRVDLTAKNGGADKKFVGWMINGSIVSTKEKYSFYIMGDTTAEAVYQDVVEETPEFHPAPSVSMSGSATFDLSGQYPVMYFSGQAFLPNDPAYYRIEEVGTLRTKNNAGTLTLENADGTAVKKSVMAYNAAGQFVLAIKTLSGSQWDVVAYVTYTDLKTGEVITVYSGIVSAVAPAIE